MKNLFYKLGTQAAVTLTMLLLVFAPFQSLIAQAQQTCGTPGADAATCIPSGAAAATPSATPNAVTNNTAAPSTSNLFGACSLYPSQFSPTGCISAIIYAFTIGIGSVFAYVAAYFFDITIQLSLNGASYGLDFISTSWTTARDLGNMAFLFILLYIAFTIIFKADTSSTKTMLATVILVALLVNFSFFFTRVVIDAGNILSIQFYNAIPAPPISQTIQGSSPAASAVASVSSQIGGTAGGTKDLTAGIMNMLNVQGLLNNNSFSQTNGNFIATILIYIAGAIVLWLLTIAFITNGIKFLVRVVILWFLIIASPLALIALAVPGMGGYFTQWREMLVKHSFYPVAFMFIFLVLNNFAVTMSSPSNALTSGVFTTTQTTGASSFGAIGASLVALAIRLALVIAVLYIGMKASDSISVKGSEAAGKVGGWFGGKFIGTYGALGRNTIGHAAYSLSQREGFQTAAANNAFVRTLWRGTNTVAKSSFDARTALKAAGVKDIAGVSMSTKNKDGYKGVVDARIKAREAQAKEFNELSDDQKAQVKANVEKSFETERVANASLTASANRQKEEAAAIQKQAEDKAEAAKKREKAAEQEFEKAKQTVTDYEVDGKQNTPEMDSARVTRDSAREKLNALKSERESLESDAKKHDSKIQEFTNKIKDLAAEKKEIDEKVKNKIKAEETRLTPKNIFADSLAGKNGRFGNMSRAGFWIPAADKKAAGKIRKGKDNKDKLKDLVKDMEKEDAGDKEEKKDEPKAEKKEDKKDEHH